MLLREDYYLQNNDKIPEDYKVSSVSAEVLELVDRLDLESSVLQKTCRFDSCPRHRNRFMVHNLDLNMNPKSK